MIKKYLKMKYLIMEYQKVIDLLDNTPNQPKKSRTKN